MCTRPSWCTPTSTKAPNAVDVGDDAFELHAGLQVGDLLDALLEGRRLELGARVAAGLLQLGEDVGDGRDAEVRVGEVLAGSALAGTRGRR